MLSLFFSYLPILLLIYLMTKPKSMASSKALPLSALIIYLISLFVFKQDLLQLNATVISGLLLALTPLSIIAGAIFLFKAMEVSGALDLIKQWLNSVSTNQLAQVMIIGWAFAFLIEGASGFGTPAAIAGPVLYSLGFPVLRVAIFCLVLNTIPVTFGAVGTPIWFGLSVVDLSSAQISEIAWKAALLNTIAAPFIVIAALYIILQQRTAILRQWIFVLASTFACTLPYLLLSLISYEFPSLLGGMIGLVVTLLLAKYNIGLSKDFAQSDSKDTTADLTLSTLFKASFPLLGTVLLLVITRIQELGIKSMLQAKSPAFGLSLGSFGDLSVSSALVVSLQNILGTDESWQHAFLYVPSILPFLLIGVITIVWFGKGSIKHTAKNTMDKIKSPFFALLGALVFVNLMMFGDDQSPVTQIGNHLAEVTGQSWQFFAPVLGALGSFFSGSATISNLTFAGIQQSIATQLGLNLTTVLALQSVGAAMGNMVCINNIVAVTSILGIQNKDGVILKRTAIILLLYAVIAGGAGLLI
ncbi:L-lactate permease [Glaciecola sp. 1036]|uniref:L-lactate permease n=1 Tax=Alteromonadaceae TaxID=72275 RepID=UPI003D02277B